MLVILIKVQTFVAFIFNGAAAHLAADFVKVVEGCPLRTQVVVGLTTFTCVTMETARPALNEAVVSGWILVEGARVLITGHSAWV